VGDGAKVGPFVYLAPGTKVPAYQSIGSKENME